MKAIKVQIVAFIDDHQPGFVECKFYDAFGKEHIVQDKGPVVSKQYLDANSQYPQEGTIACEVVKEWKNSNGNTIFTVDTTKPWHVDTIEGQTQFDLFEEQLTEFRQ